MSIEKALEAKKLKENEQKQALMQKEENDRQEKEQAEADAAE